MCLVMYIPQKLMTMEEYFNLIVQGFADMLPILMLLLIAFVLQSVTEGLGMTDYIIEVAQPFLTGAAFPAVVFVLLAAICFATGSLWGMSAVMAPIVFPLGAAIGAKMGCPDKTVVNIAGDGCFRMNMNEIATAVRCGRPLVQIVLNNHVLGMVRQWQDLFYDERYSATVLRDAVDFVKLAEAMGAEGVRAESQEQFREAFAWALTLDKPVVIDCQIDSDDKVWPMVAPGAAISEAFDEEDMVK